MKKQKLAFTLIELMIVIAIIAVLAAVLVPNLRRASQEARLSACMQNMKNISTAVEMYNVDNYQYPTGVNREVTSASFPELVNKKYLETPPTCPASKLYYRYFLDSAQQVYSISCPDPSQHRKITNNTLYFSSVDGLIKD